MEIYTIGFTQTTAEHFFGRLKAAGVQRLLDVRLNNSSQLAGFAKAKDLPVIFSVSWSAPPTSTSRFWLPPKSCSMSTRSAKATGDPTSVASST